MPPPKSEEELKAEEELGQALRNWSRRTKPLLKTACASWKKAKACGLSFANPAKDTKSLPRAGNVEKEVDKNAARTLKRFLDQTKKTRVISTGLRFPYSIQKRKIEPSWLPFLLPHEWLSDVLRQQDAGARNWPRCAKLARSMVPVNSGRVVFELPCPEQFEAHRVPTCCLVKYNAGPETCEAICEVTAWGLKKLGEGKFSQPVNSIKDKKRKQRAGQCNACKGNFNRNEK